MANTNSKQSATTAYVALGSNLGDRCGTIEQAVSRLNACADINVVRLSPIIETEPVGGPPGQGSFLNAVAQLDCHCSAKHLYATMQRIENDLGRVRTEKWGPRTIDLDLLLFGDQIIDTPELQVPHPRMHERTFVIEPLAAIAPDIRHPTLDVTIGEIERKLAKGNN